MHIPDGVLKPEIWVPLAAASAATVAVAARTAGKRLQDESIPLVGVMGAFVFALQMLNFPIAAGVSDHIVGAALLAIIFGPSIAVTCMAAILVIQCLLFGDGGVAALGANVFNMAVASPFASYWLFRALGGRSPIAVIAATVAGVLAGALGAAAWVMLSQPYGVKFLAAMLLTHLVSGAVEAAVTLAVVRTLQGVTLAKGVAKEAPSG